MFSLRAIGSLGAGVVILALGACTSTGDFCGVYTRTLFDTQEIVDSLMIHDRRLVESVVSNEKNYAARCTGR